MVLQPLLMRLTSFWIKSGVNQRIYELLDKTDIDDVSQLAKAGTQIRQWIIDTPFQPALENAIRDAYAQLSSDDENASFCRAFLRYGGRYARCLVCGSAGNVS
ncbi:phosphoenolpyruvate synthase [Salmonella enterica subsp. arizonae]|uniref:Phosphoenolpyruvate synthase n=1 Tax=Salmonella enterica subsp. arizonae TaxID=59203 RepID=A0A379TD09_SALER|nr:phosphoenolpyruvate synthase [Salmonella enterica subsp. arizonae]